ncbi:MAG: hypothetical protein Q8O87_04170 [bacterium]|nr:hypothetical protein [bacterium]
MPISQSSWNLDALDGYGPSGETLDSSKAQIYVIDLQWLGVGKVRFGYVAPGGATIYCHAESEVYMTTANLPLRYEIRNTGITGSSTSMKQICATVTSEGGIQYQTGRLFSASNSSTPQAITTRASVLSIRPKNTFNSIKNRGAIIILEFELMVETKPVFYELVYKGTVTGGSWTSVSANSISEYSTTKAVVTGGIVVSSGYVIAAAGTQKINLAAGQLRDLPPLGSDYAGTAQDEFSIVCTGIGGAASVYASIEFRERR